MLVPLPNHLRNFVYYVCPELNAQYWNSTFASQDWTKKEAGQDAPSWMSTSVTDKNTLYNCLVNGDYVHPADLHGLQTLFNAMETLLPPDIKTSINRNYMPQMSTPILQDLSDTTVTIDNISPRINEAIWALIDKKYDTAEVLLRRLVDKIEDQKLAKKGY